MKPTLLAILVLLLTLGTVFTVEAEEAGTLWIEATSPGYQAGDTLMITFAGTTDVPVNGFTYQLQYDPACLRYESLEGVLEGMSPFEALQPGLLDVTFYGQTPQVPAGALVEMTFTILAECRSSISLEAASLLILDDSGFGQVLPGVELLVVTLPLELGSPSILPEEPLASPEMASNPMPAVVVPGPALTAGTEAVQTQAGNPEEQKTLAIQGMEAMPRWVLLLILLSLASLAFAVSRIFVRSKRGHSLPAIPPGLLGDPILVIQGQPGGGQRVGLPKLPARIGRGDPNEVNLSSRHVSRQHAQIHASRSSFFITDLGSKNGTFVNGRRLHNQSMQINAGDRLRFGRDVQAEFRLQSDMELTL